MWGIPRGTRFSCHENFFMDFQGSVSSPESSSKRGTSELQFTDWPGRSLISLHNFLQDFNTYQWSLRYDLCPLLPLLLILSQHVHLNFDSKIVTSNVYFIRRTSSQKCTVRVKRSFRYNRITRTYGQHTHLTVFRKYWESFDNRKIDELK